MASYEVIFKRCAEKDLHDLSKGTIKRVLTRIEELQRDPRPRQPSKLTGAGQLYRVRVSDFRIIYAVDEDEREVIVHYVRHRRDAFNPDSSRLAIGGKIIEIWDLPTGSLLTTLEGKSLVNSLAWSPDGRFLLSTAGVHPNVSVYLWQITP